MRPRHLQSIDFVTLGAELTDCLVTDIADVDFFSDGIPLTRNKGAWVVNKNTVNTNKASRRSFAKAITAC